jgi:hypothetical protein
MIDMGVFLGAVAGGARGTLAWVHTPRSGHGGLNHALTAKEGRAGMLVSRVAAVAAEEGGR